MTLNFSMMCGILSAQTQPQIEDAIKKLTDFAGIDCESDHPAYSSSSYQLKFESASPSTLIHVSCPAGAYSTLDYFATLGSSNNLNIIAFAVPVIDEKSKVIGWSAETSLTNGSFDEKKSIISFMAAGSGNGSTYVAGDYRLKNVNFFDGFKLVKFVQDKSIVKDEVITIFEVK